MKTAVEWLIARFHYEGFIGTFCSEEQIKAKRDVMIEIIEQAKEMEKNQNKYFYDHGFYTGRCTDNNKNESFEYFFNSYKSE
jgi:hypothetical protein